MKAKSIYTNDLQRSSLEATLSAGNSSGGGGASCSSSTCCCCSGGGSGYRTDNIHLR